MELIIYNPQIPELIKFNNEELIAELTDKLGHYNNLTYTDTEIKTAKADRATLNKFKLAIDNRRKEIKAQCNQPYLDFETKVKRIIEMIDQPILAIDTQVKSYEQKVKTEKREEIIAYFNESIGELVELVPIEKVWVEKWLNTAETMKNIKEDIKLVLEKVRSDLQIISSLQSEFELQMRETYLRGLNLTAALQEKTHLEEQKAKQEAYNKAQEEKREQARLEAEEQARIKAERIELARLAKEEADRKYVEPVKEPELVIEPTPEPEPISEVVEVIEVAIPQVVDEIAQEIIPEVCASPEVMQIDFRVWVTPLQLEALKGFLTDFEIKYGKVD